MASPENLPAPVSGEPPPVDHGGDFRTLLHLILDKAWLIALCITLAVLVAAYKVKNAPRIYQATATAQVEQQEKQIVKVEQIMREDLRSQEILNTIVQKFRSRPLLLRVVITNQLTHLPTLIGDAAPGTVKAEDLVGTLEGMVSANLRRGTRLIDVSVAHTDPKLTALIANSLVEEYLAQDVQYVSSATKGAYGYLREETERLKKKLETAELALHKYREEAGIVSLQQGQDTITPQIRDLSGKVAQARAETIRIQMNLDRTVKLKDNPLLLPQIATDPAVLAARTTVLRTEQDFQILCLRYKAKHPKYIDAFCQLEQERKTLDTALTNAFTRAVEGLQVDLEHARMQEAGFEKALKEAEGEALKVSQSVVKLSLLMREVEADRALFDSVLNRLKETSLTVEMQSQPEKIRFIQPAVVPGGPISPNIKRMYLIAVAAGLMAGIMLSLGINALDTSFKSIEQTEAYLQLPVLAAIPRLKEVKPDAQFVAAEGSNSSGAEAFRTLRTSLSMLGREEDRKSFLFTSAFPQEGKTFSSINYAISLAQQGLRTILIDLDLRRPSVEECITGKNNHSIGVTDYLLGQKKLAEIVQNKQEMANFYWIAAGRTAPNPAELLAHPTLAKLLEDVMHHYDRVIIDSAPIHAVSDSLLISNKVQTTVIVVRGDKTPRKPVLRSIQLLRNSGANPGGVILNLVPSRRGRGYGYYYYDSYYYHGY